MQGISRKPPCFMISTVKKRSGWSKSNGSLYSDGFHRWTFARAHGVGLNHFRFAAHPSNSARALVSELLALKSLQTRFNRLRSPIRWWQPEVTRVAGSRGWCFKLPDTALSMVTSACCIRSDRESRRRIERLRMIAADDRHHSDHENRLDEHLTRHQARHAELRVVDRELRARREKRALLKFRLHVRKTARKTRQGDKQAVVGKEAVHAEPDLRGAARMPSNGRAARADETLPDVVPRRPEAPCPPRSDALRWRLGRSVLDAASPSLLRLVG